MKQENIEKLTVKNKAISNELHLDFINFSEIERLFNYKGPEIEFFKAEIIERGLEDFRLTIASGITDSQKRKIVREEILNWDRKGEERIRVTFL